MDIAPGFPGNGLTDAQQLARFEDCAAYAAHPLPRRQLDGCLGGVAALESLADARRLIDLLVLPQRLQPA
jgi:hypothetical protein